MKVNVWISAPATASDLKSAQGKSSSISTRRCVNKAKSEKTLVEVRGDIHVCLYLCLSVFVLLIFFWICVRFVGVLWVAWVFAPPTFLSSAFTSGCLVVERQCVLVCVENRVCTFMFIFHMCVCAVVWIFCVRGLVCVFFIYFVCVSCWCVCVSVSVAVPVSVCLYALLCSCVLVCVVLRYLKGWSDHTACQIHGWTQTTSHDVFSPQTCSMEEQQNVPQPNWTTWWNHSCYTNIPWLSALHCLQQLQSGACSTSTAQPLSLTQESTHLPVGLTRDVRTQTGLCALCLPHTTLLQQTPPRNSPSRNFCRRTVPLRLHGDLREAQTLNNTDNMMPATFADASTQLSFAEFFEHCILSSALPPRPQPSSTSLLDAAHHRHISGEPLAALSRPSP